MSIETAETLFIIQKAIVSAIEDEAQPQLLRIKKADIELRLSSQTLQGPTQHVMRFEMNRLVNQAIQRVLESAEYAYQYVDVEAIRGHVLLLLASMNCIDWVGERPGTNYGVMEVCVLPVNDDPNIIASSTVLTFVQLVHLYDSLSFDGSSFVVRERGELVISPEYRRQRRTLTSNGFCFTRFELGSDVPWLRWDAEVAAFRGIVPLARPKCHAESLGKSGGSDSQERSRIIPLLTMSIIIKATVLERHQRSELRLKRTIRARVNIDVHAWWEYPYQTTLNYTSLRSVRPNTKTDSISRTVPARRRTQEGTEVSHKSLFEVFPEGPHQAPPYPMDVLDVVRESWPSYTQKPRDVSSGTGKVSRKPTPHQFSFDEGSESRFVAKAVEAVLRSGDSKGDALVSSTASNINVFEVRVSHPEMPSHDALSSLHRELCPPDVDFLFRTSSGGHIAGRRFTGSQSELSESSVPNYVSSGSTAYDLLRSFGEDFAVASDQLSAMYEENLLESRVGGRFEPLIGITESAISDPPDNDGECTEENERNAAGNPDLLGTRMNEEFESKDLEDPADSPVSSSELDLGSRHQPRIELLHFSPESADDSMREMQEFYEVDRLQHLQRDLAVFEDVLSEPTDPESSSPSDSNGQSNGGTPTETQAPCNEMQDELRQEPAIEPDLSPDAIGNEGLTSEAWNANEVASNESLSELEVDRYDANSATVQVRSLRRSRRKNSSRDKGTGRPKKLYRMASPSKRGSPSKPR